MTWAPAADSSPSASAWRGLWRVSRALYDQGPWRWLREVHVFGVPLPKGPMGYVSVSGSDEDTPGVTVYLGPEGWAAFWAAVEFLAAGVAVPEELAWETPALRLMYVSWEDLARPDQELLERLGVTTEEGPWPVWRSLRPGFAPWYLDTDEVHWLTVALRATLRISEWLREVGPDIVLDRMARGELLVGLPEGEENGASRRVTWMPLPEAVSLPYQARLSPALLHALAALPTRPLEIEVDCAPLPVAVQDAPAERPAVPYLFLVVTETGDVLAGEALIPRVHVREVYEALPSQWAEALTRAGFRPTRLAVRRPVVESLVRPFAEQVDILVERRPSLRVLDQVRVAVLRRIQGESDSR